MPAMSFVEVTIKIMIMPSNNMLRSRLENKVSLPPHLFYRVQIKH